MRRMYLRWKMHCYDVECEQKNKIYQWVSPDDLNKKIPIPTAFRKCL